MPNEIQTAVSKALPRNFISRSGILLSLVLGIVVSAYVPGYGRALRTIVLGGDLFSLPVPLSLAFGLLIVLNYPAAYMALVVRDFLVGSLTHFDLIVPVLLSFVSFSYLWWRALDLLEGWLKKMVRQRLTANGK